MAVTSKKFPGTTSSETVTGGSSTNWVNTSNIGADDTSEASWAESTAGPDDSPRLIGENYGFTTSDIPSGATIDGREEDEVHREGAATDNISTLQRRTKKTGTLSTSNVSNMEAGEWRTGTAGNGDTITAGGATNLWGETWTDSDARASNTGSFMRCTGTGTTPDAFVDNRQVRWYYTVASNVTIAVPLVDKAKVAYTPVVSPGASVIVPLKDKGKVAYAPTVSAGIFISIPLASKAKTAYTPVVASGAQAVVPLADKGKVAYTPSVAAGAGISVPLVNKGKIAYTPAISIGAYNDVPLVNKSKVAYVPTIVIQDGTVTIGVPIVDKGKLVFTPNVNVIPVPEPLPTFSGDGAMGGVLGRGKHKSLLKQWKPVPFEITSVADDDDEILAIIAAVA